MGCILMCGCHKTKKETIQTTKLNVETVTSMDKEQMYLDSKDGNYRWYETLILLDKYLDEDNPQVAEVVNIFQSVVDYDGKSFDTYVYKYQHFADGTSASECVKAFWIEDYPLVDSLITITYDQAFEKVQQVNLPKPHSRHVCLRNPIGPKECNPQWVFGNIESQIWVDAKTGDIKTSNPAFPDGFKYAFNW